jgi:hypothetical protein
MNFGFYTLGKHRVIKINCKLCAVERIELEQAYSSLLIKKIGKGLTRIEGCLTEEYDFLRFKLHLDCAIKRSKIFYMGEELHQLEQAYRNAESKRWLQIVEEDELPF